MFHTEFPSAESRLRSAGCQTCGLADFPVGRPTFPRERPRVEKPATPQTGKSALASASVSFRITIFRSMFFVLTDRCRKCKPESHSAAINSVSQQWYVKLLKLVKGCDLDPPFVSVGYGDSLRLAAGWINSKRLLRMQMNRTALGEQSDLLCDINCVCSEAESLCLRDPESPASSWPRLLCVLGGGKTAFLTSAPTAERLVTSAPAT